jgi:hypothetical protein
VLFALTAALICTGQAPKPPAPAATATQNVRPDGAVIAKIESGFEDRLRALDSSEPFVLLGATSGVYVSGYGMVFTTPLDLAATPQVSPFEPVIPKTKAVAVHKVKLAHLPLVRQALQDAVKGAANQLKTLGPGEKIVFAVRVFYLDWEDKTGLPSQIVATADRDSAIAGKIQMDQQ